MRLAEYQCLTCNQVWTQPAAPTVCPMCDALYVKWLNYETQAKKGK
jgi:rubrerythrin